MKHRGNPLTSGLGRSRLGRRGLVVAVCVALSFTAACTGGDDDAEPADDSTSSSVVGPTEPGRSTTSPDEADPEADPTTTAAEGDGKDTSTTEAPSSTTSPNLPPNDSPLADLLLASSAFGPGFAPDDSLGDGTFDADMCEDVTLEATFDDQAGQGLSAGQDAETVSVTQTIIRFADEAEAEAFAASVAQGIADCQPGTTATEVPAGEGATLFDGTDEMFAMSGAVVRVGDLVSCLTAFGSADSTLPLTADIVEQVAERLTA